MKKQFLKELLKQMLKQSTLFVGPILIFLISFLTEEVNLSTITLFVITILLSLLVCCQEVLIEAQKELNDLLREHNGR